MSGKRVVVAGSNFAGFTAALKLKEYLREDDRVIVVANSHRFLFTPSLIWVPFGLRAEEEITFDLRPIYEKHGIEFREERITRFDLQSNLVVTENSTIPYDFLLVATGPKPDYDSAPGMKPGEFNHPIVTLKDAFATADAWKAFLKNPGPIVIGAIQGSACFGAAYEFMFNARYQLSKEGIDVPMTFVTAEPYLSHFGIGGFGQGQKMCEWMFDHYGIQWRADAAIKEIKAGSVVLDSGEELKSAFTSIVPRFVGADAVRATPGLALPNGFIEVDEGYQHKVHSNVYAAGVAVHVEPPEKTKHACGVPRTGYPSEEMAKIAAWNIAARLYGDRSPRHQPFAEMKALCVLDTGNMGMMILGDHMLAPRKREMIVPGPQAHWAKLGFEKYFLSSRRRGHV